MMDGVESVRDIQQFFPSVRSTITYVSDPVFFPFANDVKTFSGDTLVIEVGVRQIVGRFNTLSVKTRRKSLVWNMTLFSI